MRKILFFISLSTLVLLIACSKKEENEDLNTIAVSKQIEIPTTGDRMLYGLSCDGTNDTVVVFLPFGKGKDPVVYNIEIAKKEGRVIGRPEIGDWVGIMLNPEDPTEATMLVDLDHLKGTWTYKVYPTWKDASKLSRRALRRRVAEMPDSIKDTYLIPREYGFSLQRSSVAHAVGYVMRKSSLEDDSPVEYPEIKRYSSWGCRNGRLILARYENTPSAQALKNKTPRALFDTLDFVSLSDDSLILRTTNNEIVRFRRQLNAMSANVAAQKAEANKKK